MPRRKTAVTFIGTISLLIALLGAISASADTRRPVGGHGFPKRPFMLFVTPLRPPVGWHRSAGFSRAVFRELKRHFDHTTYQVILVESVTEAERMSNSKRDIILFTDSTDYLAPGPGPHDTLLVWSRYRTGFLFSRIDIPVMRGAPDERMQVVGERIVEIIRDEFLGEVMLEGGPPGMVMTIMGRVRVQPPCQILMPAGQYKMISYYPEFASRHDTLSIMPGRENYRRILLLPEE
jgi:hypothetical protein